MTKCKRKKNEPIGQWLVRIAKKLNLSEELTVLMFEVRRESFNEGLEIGKEIQKKLEHIQNN